MHFKMSSAIFFTLDKSKILLSGNGLIQVVSNPGLTVFTVMTLILYTFTFDLQNRMRLTSQCLQRWLASWMAFVVIWCADYVIYWLSHPPNILGIMEFLSPLVLLLLLCSAYAEANGEGQRMIRVRYVCT